MLGRGHAHHGPTKIENVLACVMMAPKKHSHGLSDSCSCRIFILHRKHYLEAPHVKQIPAKLLQLNKGKVKGGARVDPFSVPLSSLPSQSFQDDLLAWDSWPLI